MHATFFSSFALLGAPGMVYRDGVVFALFSLNVPVAGVAIYLLGDRIRKIGRQHGYITPADMISAHLPKPRRPAIIGRLRRLALRRTLCRNADPSRRHPIATTLSRHRRL